MDALRLIPFFLFYVACSQTTFAKRLPKLIPFQENIKSCLNLKLVENSSIVDLAGVYNYISDKYLLVSSEIIEREVIYKEGSELKKLRLDNGNVQLFKILEQEEQRHVPVKFDLNTELRQKPKTLESLMSQILVKADIRSDWMRTKEKRLEDVAVVVLRVDSQIKSLKIDLNKSKKRLDCSLSEQAHVCTCADLK